MNFAQHKTKYLLILFIGIVIFVGFSQFMALNAQKDAQNYAVALSKGQSRGLLVLLYDNPFFTGPAQKSIRPTCRYQVLAQKDKEKQPVHASWQWLAKMRIPQDGEYILDIFAAEAVRLFIDGKAVIDHWAARAPRHLKVMLDLKKGSHLFDLRNVQSPHHLVLSLMWAKPKAQEITSIPTNVFTALNPQKTNPQTLWQINQNYRKWQALTWLLPVAWLILWLIFLPGPQALLKTCQKHWGILLIVTLAGLLRLLWADIVPGVSGESGFFLWRAELISQGARPFQGMISRTGPFLDYLLALPVMAFGASAWLLRSASAILNTLALIFCYRVFLREADKKSALIASLILACFPAVVIFSRNPVDYTSLGPLLFFMGLDLFSLSRKKPPLSVLGGILWGIGIFNHSIFVVFPATLGLGGLLVSRFKVLKHHLYWGAGLGMLLAMAPRLIERLIHNPKTPMSFFKLERFLELGGFTDILLKTIDGKVIYQLYTGQYTWQVYGVIPLFLLASYLILTWGFFKKNDNQSYIDAILGLSIIIFILMAPIGAPTANPRYFAYCTILAGLVIARGFTRTLFWSNGGFNKATIACLALFVLFSLTSLSINYFHTHLKTGGVPLAWRNKLLDHVSDAWMNHKELAQALIKKGYPVVATADRWHHTLHLALNLYQKQPRKFEATPIESPSTTERAAVFYNSREGRFTLRRYISGNPDKAFKRVSLGPRLDRKYILLERVSPTVPYSKAMEEIR